MKIYKIMNPAYFAFFMLLVTFVGYLTGARTATQVITPELEAFLLVDNEASLQGAPDALGMLTVFAIGVMTLLGTVPTFWNNCSLRIKAMAIQVAYISIINSLYGFLVITVMVATIRRAYTTPLPQTPDELSTLLGLHFGVVMSSWFFAWFINTSLSPISEVIFNLGKEKRKREELTSRLEAKDNEQTEVDPQTLGSKPLTTTSTYYRGWE